MKKTLVTEYNSQELQTIIEQAVTNALNEKLKPFFSLLANQTDKSPEKLLSRHDLKKLLRLSYPTIMKLTLQGSLRAKVIGGKYMYRESDIVKFLNSKNV
jgi:hypothetical protein